MKKIILSGIAGLTMTLGFGCVTGTHSSVTTSEKTTMPDLNTNTVTPNQTTTTNLNPATTSDIEAPK